MVKQARVIRIATQSEKPNKVIKESGVMPVYSRDEPIGNMVTGRLLRNKRSRKRLLNESRRIEDKEAAIFIWNHPERLEFVRNSPFGEGKNLNDPDDFRNLRLKSERGVIDYNEYKFRYKNKTWKVKAEVMRGGYEQLYFVGKKQPHQVRP